MTTEAEKLDGNRDSIAALPDEARDKFDAEKNVTEQTGTLLEGFDVSLLHSYIAQEITQKSYENCDPDDQDKIQKISDLILKRIKQLQRVPLDITISSWISTVSGILGSNQSTEKLHNNVNTIANSYQSIHSEYTKNIQKILSTRTTVISGGKRMQKLEDAFSSLEKNIYELKNDKVLLKESAKKQNLSIKEYYKSQTRQYINEFITILHGQSHTQTTDVPVQQPDFQNENNNDKLTNSQAVESFIDKVDNLEGTKYKRGGDDERGIDCSGLIIEGWKKSGIVSDSFDTTAAGLYTNYVSKISDINQIQRGDLIFYQNKKSIKLYKKGQVSHVMIALGPVENGKIRIFDASVSSGVKERVISAEGNKKYEILAGRPDRAYQAIVSNTQLLPQQNV